MAKGSIALGRFRGKAGGFVFRTDPEVGQIISVKPEHVSNPRTAAQTVQRNKMNLAGQLSKLTPYDAIAGLGGSRRKARSMFVSGTLKSIEAGTPSASATYREQVRMRDLVFSKGITIPTRSNVDFDIETEIATITVTNEGTDLSVIGFRVVGVYCLDDKVKGVMVEDATLAAGQSAVTITRAIPSSYGGGTVDLFVIPIYESNEQVRTVYQQGIACNAGMLSTEVVRTLVGLGAFAASNYNSNWALGE